MKNNKKQKPKNLRALYATSKEATAFLEKYPEFDNIFLEQSEANHPVFQTKKGRYTLHEVPADKPARADQIMHAIEFLEKGSPTRLLLEAYFSGVPLKQLAEQFKIKTRGALDSRIHDAKQRALKASLSTDKVKIDHTQGVATSRKFTYNGVMKVVNLMFDTISNDFVWVHADTGLPLPKYAQKILDENSDIKEWDDILL